MTHTHIEYCRACLHTAELVTVATTRRVFRLLGAEPAEYDVCLDCADDIDTNGFVSVTCIYCDARCRLRPMKRVWSAEDIAELCAEHTRDCDYIADIAEALTRHSQERAAE